VKPGLETYVAFRQSTAECGKTNAPIRPARGSAGVLLTLVFLAIGLFALIFH
jgi:hypothetical protein